MERQQDLGLGVLFVLLGLFMASQAAQYAGASGAYPLALSLLLAGMGAIVAARAIWRRTNAARPLTTHPVRLLVAALFAAAYFALVPRLGFYTASALLVVSTPVALGFRRPVYVAVATLVFVATVWVVFSLVLEKPLRREIWLAHG